MFPEPTVSLTHSPPRCENKGRTERGNLSLTPSKAKHREIPGVQLVKTFLRVPVSYCADHSRRWPRFTLAAVTEDSATHLERVHRHTHTLYLQSFLTAHLLLHIFKSSVSSQPGLLLFYLVGSQLVSPRCRGTAAWGTCSLCPLRFSQGTCVSCMTRRTCPDWRWSRGWPRMAAAFCRTTARAQRGQVRWDTQQHCCSQNIRLNFFF